MSARYELWWVIGSNLVYARTFRFRLLAEIVGGLGFWRYSVRKVLT